ncbi:MAG: HTTM domain-containing protein [Pirellulales bacterium]
MSRHERAESPGRLQRMWQSWDGFWFTPRDVATLAVIRICTGLMLLYTHLVWGLDLPGFIGPQGRLSVEQYRAFYTSPTYPEGNPFAWSHLPWIEQTPWLMPIHYASLLVFLALTVGCWTRVAAIGSALLTISYSHRLAVAQFGLDQINAMLAVYLAVGSSGAAYSWDAWWKARRTGQGSISGDNVWRVDTNIAQRLIQIHMAVIYLFAGTSKLLGASWWDGTALWGAFANLEYQTVDMTWTVNHLYLVNFLTHLTIVWEIGYCFLIWRPAWRWPMLSLAIPLHLGIAVCMGMITFGLIMLVGNIAFVEPAEMRWALSKVFPRRGAGEGTVPMRSRPSRTVRETAGIR